MKKILLSLIALVAMAVSASAQTVYISTGDGAVAYHKSKSCSYLTNSKDVKSTTPAEAKKMGRHAATALQLLPRRQQLLLRRRIHLHVTRRDASLRRLILRR